MTKATPTDDPNFLALKQRVRSGKCFAFIGAGMSLPVYPRWKELLARICEACNIDLDNYSYFQNKGNEIKIDELLLKSVDNAKKNNPEAYYSKLSHFLGCRS